MSRHDRTAMGLVYALLIALAVFLIADMAWPLVVVIACAAVYAGWGHRDRLPVGWQRWLEDWRCSWGFVAALFVTLLIWGAA